MQKANELIYRFEHNCSIDKGAYNAAIASAQRRNGKASPSKELVAELQSAADTYLQSKGGTQEQRAARIAKLTPNVAASRRYMELVAVAHLLTRNEVRGHYKRFCLKGANLQSLYHPCAKKGVDTSSIPIDDIQVRSRFIRAFIDVEPRHFSQLEHDSWAKIGRTPDAQADTFKQLKVRYRGYFALADLDKAESDKALYSAFYTAHSQQIDAHVVTLKDMARAAMQSADEAVVSQIRRGCRKVEQETSGGVWRAAQIDGFVDWHPDIARYTRFDAAARGVSSRSAGGQALGAFFRFIRDAELPRYKRDGTRYSSTRGFFEAIGQSGIEFTVEGARKMGLYARPGTAFGSFFKDGVAPWSEKLVAIFAEDNTQDYRRVLLEQDWANLTTIDPAALGALQRYDDAHLVRSLRQLATSEASIQKADLPGAHAVLQAVRRQYETMQDPLSRAHLCQRLKTSIAAWVDTSYQVLASSYATGADWTRFYEEMCDITGGLGTYASPTKIADMVLWGRHHDAERMRALDEALSVLDTLSAPPLRSDLQNLLRKALVSHFPTHRSDALYEQAHPWVGAIALALTTQCDGFLPEAFYNARHEQDVHRAWHWYSMLCTEPLRDTYRAWWAALAAGDDVSARSCLQTLMRSALRRQVRDAHYVDTIQGLAGLRLFLQTQMGRLDASNVTYGKAMARRLKTAWANSELTDVLPVLASTKLLLPDHRQLAVSWGMERFFDWHPDEPRLRGLATIVKRDDLRSIRGDHPGIDRLVHFLLAMEGPAAKYSWRDPTSAHRTRVALDATQVHAYGSQAEHVAQTLPASDHVVEVLMGAHASALVHGNDGALAGPALASYAEQITLGLLVLQDGWPEEVGATLLKMNAGACIDHQVMALQTAIDELHQEGLVRLELPEGLSREVFFERCCIAFRSQAIARYCREHSLPRHQDPSTFEDDASFKSDYYAPALFLDWVNAQNFAQRWSAQDVAAAMTHLQDLDLLGAQGDGADG